MNRWVNCIKVFSMSALLLFGTSLQAKEALDYSSYERLLKTYVEGDGVRYAAWAANEVDVAALRDFVATLGQADVAILSKADQTAFYINLYNAAMLSVVLEKYPIRSVKTIGTVPFSIFKKDFIKLADRKVSLDEIEKEILLRDYFDPRIHFALNCASESCPPLRAEPFVGDRLEQQLQEQATLFAESGRAARIDKDRKRIAYSEIFKWYADDFGSGDPAEYLNRYRKVPLPTDYSVDWITYDWALNSTTKDQ